MEPAVPERSETLFRAQAMLVEAYTAITHHLNFFLSISP